MKKYLFMLAGSIILPSISYAQQVSYSYDAAGNRVARSTSVGAPQLLGVGKARSKVSKAMQQTLSVGPNPTSDVLHIRLSSWNETDNCRLQVINMSGQVLIEQSMTASETTLDISNYAKGYYLLSVDLNGEKSSYKIIKN